MQQHCKAILHQHSSKRSLAIDVFRGITITAMILVNNPGNWSHVYWPLLHAEWHGWTPTDLIFPFFLFLVGWSIYASKLASLEGQHGLVSSMQTLKQGSIRSLKLFALGLFLAIFYYNFADPSFSWIESRLLNIRVMGVLQRIAVVYLATLCIVMFLGLRGQIFSAALLFGLYLVGVYLIPYADAAGNVYQGALLRGTTFIDYIDTLILGRAHVYQSNLQPFASEPEGILSTLPAIVSCLTGVWLARWMSTRQVSTVYCTRLLVAGILMVLFAQGLSILVPINKPMWTPSYVLLSSGFAVAMVGIISYILELKRYRVWSAPFVVFGVNSIAFFMFAGVLARVLIMIPIAETTLKQWFYQAALVPIFGQKNGSLVFALLFLMLSYLVMYTMYKRHIFWKV